MSTSPSNLYAEKILSEHPLAMWSLDDKAEYVSLITESFRNVSLWEETDGTLSSVSSVGAPFPNSHTTSIVGEATPTKNIPGITYLKSASNFSSGSDNYSVSFYIKTSDWAFINCGFSNKSATVSQISVVDEETVIYQTTANHNFIVGDYVTVSGTTFSGDSYYDGSGEISAVTSNTFQIEGRDGGFGSGSQSTTGTALEGKFQSQSINPKNYPKDSWIPVCFYFFEEVTSKKLAINLSYNDVSPTYYINGLTIGKDSEPFNGESFGQSLVTLPTSIATTQTQGVVAKSFGTQEYDAYYIGSEETLYAKTAGMSMSYGSENSMIVYPHATAGQPSFIFPGFAMLNDLGRYKELTLEMLIRINAKNSTPKRIVGPLASTDGIYVDKDFLILKIGDSVGSYYMSELFRPMVLQLQIGRQYANLTIDGETVIFLQIDNASLSLPSATIGSPAKSQDWFGIFAYSDIQTLEVDSIAIYPYKCSSVLGKRRLVFAQGVEVPEIANSSYNGSTVLFDFKNANYTSNYDYPSYQAKWEQATIVDNFDVVDLNSLSSRVYAKPQISTSSYSVSNLLSDMYATNIASSETSSFINLKPSTVVSGSGRSWSSVSSNIVSNSFDKKSHLSGGFYGVFKSLETSVSEQVLIKFLNEKSGEYFKVSITGTTVSYILKSTGVSEESIATASITQGNIFAVGADIQKFINSRTDLAVFFSNTSDISLYVGGQETESNTFSGNIYKVGLCSERNFQNILGSFNSSGILTNHTTNPTVSTLLSKTASYTVAPSINFSSLDVVVAANSYWQDYVPLSKLAKTVLNSDGQETLALDFFQLNFDYSEPRDYSSAKFNTELQAAKTYISFQTIASGSSKTISEFTNVLANESRIINATTFSATTRYEFVNGMLVYPPKNVDLNTLSLVVHVDLDVNNTSLKQFSFKNLQIAAQSFNKNSENAIGTKYGINLYSNSGNSQNSFLTFKGDTPYLYLTRHSGIRMLDGTSETYIKPGNPTDDNRISSMQMSIFADLRAFTTSNTPEKLFSITGNSGTINFYIRALGFTDSTKGFIYSDSPDAGSYAPAYYLNGKLVANPVIELNEWNVLGIAFGTPVNMSNTPGKITLNSKLLMNNISYYNASPIEVDQKSSSLLWSEVDSNSWAVVVPTQTPGRSGNQITLSTTGNHNLVIGEPITISGVQPDTYRNNGQDLWVSDISSGTSFTYQNRLADTTPITTAGAVVGTWQYSSIPDYYRINSNNIKNIYKIYLGTYKSVIDTDTDSQKLMFNKYQYSAYTDVKVNTIILDIL